MKKLFIIFFISICLIYPNKKLEAKNTKFKKGNFYEGKISWRKTEVILPEGKWQFIATHKWWYGGYGYACKDLALTEGNIFKAGIGICEMRTGGKYLHYLGRVLNKHYKRGEYDSCILRPEYYYTNLYLKGNSSNCFRIRHWEWEKELNYPDDPQDTGGRQEWRKWLKENNIIAPKILLHATHEYFAPVVSDSGPGVYYNINPELYGGPKGKYFTEDTSEYHRANINKHPEFKKFFDQWTSLSAKRHKEYEIQWKTKDHHKLDLSDVIISNDNLSLNNSSNDLIKQMKELKELYDSGVLTKEEFEKAKTQLLN